MFTSHRFVLLFLSVLILASWAAAEDLLIPAPTTADDYLNARIVADTSATGERADPDRVYVLERDGVYLLNTNIRNAGWTLRMRAQEGSGRKPVIYMVTNTATGSFPGQIVDMRGHVWLKDLILVGYIEALPDEISNIPSGLIRTNAAGFDLILDGCILTQSRGQHIRTESATRKTEIVNCIFANMGDLGLSNFGAGKAIDLRAGSCDSLIMINNTFVNFQDRIIRHRASTASINHFIFDHNTLVNGMSYHGTLALGWVGEDVTITNNLWVDTFIAGNDTDMVRQSEFEESGELDAYGSGRMTWVITVPNDSTQYKVAGNYYTVSPAVQAFYDTYASVGVTGEGSPLNWHVNKKLGADSSLAFIKEDLELANRPEPMIAMAHWYRSPLGGNKTKSTTNFNRATDDYDRRTWQFFSDTLDCTYEVTKAAYTGALGGFPAGDLNWFPQQKAQWENYLTGVEHNRPSVPHQLSLQQNYPNPFNPSTRIVFDLAVAGHTTLSVYNMLGQEVARLIDGKLNPGVHSIAFDAAHLANGVYLYKLESANQSVVKKMLLLK